MVVSIASCSVGVNEVNESEPDCTGVLGHLHQRLVASNIGFTTCISALLLAAIVVSLHERLVASNNGCAICMSDYERLVASNTCCVFA